MYMQFNNSWSYVSDWVVDCFQAAFDLPWCLPKIGITLKRTTHKINRKTARMRHAYEAANNIYMILHGYTWIMRVQNLSWRPLSHSCPNSKSIATLNKKPVARWDVNSRSYCQATWRLRKESGALADENQMSSGVERKSLLSMPKPYWSQFRHSCYIQIFEPHTESNQFLVWCKNLHMLYVNPHVCVRYP